MSNNQNHIPLHEQIRRELVRIGASSNSTTSSVSVSGSGSGSGSGILYKELSYAIGGAVIEVHRHLGPGQLESNYERALAKELSARNIPFRRQVVFASFYKGDVIGEFVADMIVNGQIIVELKAVDRVHPAHKAQLLSYLRATGLRLGLLINFNETVVWKGIRRIVC